MNKDLHRSEKPTFALGPTTGSLGLTAVGYN